MEAIPTVSEATFQDEVLASDLPVLVEFGAEWCGPCKTVAPELAALRAELAGKAKVVQVDVDHSPRIAQAIRIQSVPTFVVFVGGRPADVAQGAMKKEQLRALIEKHLPKPAGAITPTEAAKLLEHARLTPVDIRPLEVFNRTHMQNAVNFPQEGIADQLTELQELPSPGMLYCRDGKESEKLAAALAQKGVPTAYLEGGILAWEGAGYRLQRPS